MPFLKIGKDKTKRKPQGISMLTVRRVMLTNQWQD